MNNEELKRELAELETKMRKVASAEKPESEAEKRLGEARKFALAGWLYAASLVRAVLKNSKAGAYIPSDYFEDDDPKKEK